MSYYDMEKRHYSSFEYSIMQMYSDAHEIKRRSKKRIILLLDLIDSFEESNNTDELKRAKKLLKMSTITLERSRNDILKYKKLYPDLCCWWEKKNE